jgi:hypothetical protein
MRENRPSGSMSGEWKRGLGYRATPRLYVRREKAAFPSGCKSRPANSVAPAGSYRSGGGGNEAVGASETNVPHGGAASRQAVTRVNVEQAPKGLMWEPTRHINGEGRRRWRTGKRVE